MTWFVYKPTGILMGRDYLIVKARDSFWANQAVETWLREDGILCRDLRMEDYFDVREHDSRPMYSNSLVEYLDEDGNNLTSWV